MVSIIVDNFEFPENIDKTIDKIYIYNIHYFLIHI